MGRKHINEFRHTSFANSGRAAGFGMFEDRYDEESGGRIKSAEYQKTPSIFHNPPITHGEVITYKANKGENVCG